MSDEEMTEDPEPIQGKSLFVIGALLVGVGALLIPPVFNLVLAGDDPIVSGPARLVAWLVGFGMVAVGAALILLRKRIPLGNVLLAFFSLGFSLVAVEVLLRVLGVQPLAPFTWRIPEIDPTWTVSEEFGGRYTANSHYRGWSNNTLGYRDTDEFDGTSLEGKTKRVLLLGDSFSYGVAATKESNSFASILEESLGDEGVVWNTGIPGSGQKDDLIALRELGATLKPDVVVVQFYQNDFKDNLYPPGVHYHFANNKWVNRYALHADGSADVLSREDAYVRAYGAAGFVSLLKSSRLLSSAVRASIRRGEEPGAQAGINVGPTLAALKEIQSECVALDAALVVLLVPQMADIEKPSKYYEAAVTLFDDLSIDYVDVREQLAVTDYEIPPKIHWLDSGHKIAGNAIALRVSGLLSAAD